MTTENKTFNRSFPLGRLACTYGVNDRMKKSKAFSSFVFRSLERFTACDWGDGSDDDKALNDLSLVVPDRIIASYAFNKKTKIWIVTECDRSATTILFPSEY